MKKLEEFKESLAGFYLFGYRHEDKTIRLTNGSVIKKWPSEIEYMGRIYTLEEVNTLDENNDFENATYV